MRGLVSGSLALSLLFILGANASHASDALEWKNPTAPTEVTADLGTVAGKSVSGDHVIVQFAELPNSEKRAALEASGIRLLNYLGANAYFASIQSRVNIPAATRLASMTAAPIDPAAKMHPLLATPEALDYARVPATELGISTTDGKASDMTTMLACYVLFHADVDIATATSHVEAVGGKVVSLLHAAPMAVAWLPEDRVAELAAEDAVQWIEPALPPLTPTNNSNRVATQVDTVQAAPYNLTGNGVNVLIFDSGDVSNTHSDFGGRVTVIDSAGVGEHPTHVAGTVGGSGVQSGGTYRGMAPGVSLLSYSVEFTGSYIFITDLGNIETALTTSILDYGAELSNASLGSNVGINGYPCSYEGDYTGASLILDAIVRGSTGSPHISVWANGNERGDSCGSEYNTTAPPAPSKNLINVGALNSNDNSMAYFSSWGPTDDGRLKPDVCAPGCQATDDGGVTSTAPGGSYTTMCGTSMASPTVTGIVALLLEDWKRLYPGEGLPRPALVKALLAQTALDLGNPGPDYQYGYGAVQSAALIDQLRAEHFANGRLDQGEVQQLSVYVPAGTTSLKATVAWDDPPASGNVIPALVNDIDLVAIAPDGTTHYPWTLDPANPSVAAVQTQRDSRNNHEQVSVANPAEGAWTLLLTGYAIAMGPQDFSITASPDLTNCSSTGTIRIEKGLQSCDGAVAPQVIDCDLNTTTGVDTTYVTVTSTSELTGETLTLVETGPETAVFRAELPVATSDATGVLLVADGDTIAAFYQDADDGSGVAQTVQDTALVDCRAPGLAASPTISASKTRATIGLTTTEPAEVTLRLSTSCGGTYVEYASGATFKTAHTFSLGGLPAGTAHYCVFVLTDEAGNVTVDDNGGACYEFATAANLRPNFFDDFESGDLGDWEVNVGGSGYSPQVRLDSSMVNGLRPISGSTVVFLGDSTDDSDADATLDLVLDLRGTEGAYLAFNWVTAQLESDQYIQLDIYDGTWHTNVNSLRSNAEAWEYHEIPLTTYNAIDGFTIRFHSHCDYTESSDACYVDDVGVYATTLKVTPETTIASELVDGAPPSPSTADFTLLNSGTELLSWTVASDVSWLQASGATSGQLAPGATTALQFNIIGDPALLGPGLNTGRLTFRDADFGQPFDRLVTLNVIDKISLSPDTAFRAEGPEGGPFNPVSKKYVITGSEFGGTTPERWSATSDSAWVTVTPSSGEVTETAPETPVIVALDASSTTLPEGYYSGRIVFKNEDTGYVFAWLPVGLEVSTPPSGAFEWLSMNEDPGGTAEGQWAFGPPQGISGDPTAGHTGSNVVGYNLAGPYKKNMSSECYVFGPFDCSRHTGVSLNYWRWLRVSEGYDCYTYTYPYTTWSWSSAWVTGPEGGENPDASDKYCWSYWDGAAVQVSTNGTTWFDVWENSYGILDSSWVNTTHNISSYADEQATVYIRFVMGPGTDLTPEGGWNIDDLALTGTRLDPLALDAYGPFVANTCLGDPDVPARVTLTAMNADATAFDVVIASTVPWLAPGTTGFTIPAGQEVPFDVFFDGAQLPVTPGTHNGIVTVTNVTSGYEIPLTFTYNLNEPPASVQPVAPADGAVDVSVFSTLAWTGGASAVGDTEHVMYLGTSPSGMVETCRGAELYEWAPETGFLGYTTYYWTVISSNDCGKTTNPVWSFTTQDCTPAPPTPISPPDGTIDQRMDVTLTWDAVDPLSPDETEISAVDQTSMPPYREYPLRADGTTGVEASLSSSTTKSIVAFTKWADTGATGEYNNSLAALAAYFTDFTITNTTTTDPVALAAALSDVDVFFIPEQENASVTSLGSFGTTMASVLTQYVENGGTLIAACFGPEGGAGKMLTNAGLMNLTDQNLHTSVMNVVRVGTHPLLEGVPDEFSLLNGNTYLSCTTATTLVQYKNTSTAAVLVQKIGSGSVVVLGYDFYQYNSTMGLLFANAVSNARNTRCLLTYDVMIGTSPETQTLVCQDEYNTTCSVTVEPNTTYYWSVVAKNCCGVSAPATFSFTTGDCRIPPPATNPTPAIGATNTPTATYFTWDGSEYSGCLTYYDLYLGTSVTNMQALATGLVDTSYIDVDTHLQPGTLYYWAVTVRNLEGTSAGSVWSFTTARNDAQTCANDNPGFEDGFAGWNAVYTGGNSQYNWMRGSAGTGWFLNGAAYSGAAYAQNLFDGEAGASYILSQDIEVPEDAASVTVRWADRIQWDLKTYCDDCELPRTYTVEAQPAGGGEPFAELYRYSLQPQTTGDTGYLLHSVDILPVSPAIRGSTVRLVWRQEIPEEFTGPAQFDLDAICVSFDEVIGEGEGEGEGEGGVDPDIAGATTLVYMQSCGGGADLVTEALTRLGIHTGALVTSSTSLFLESLAMSAPNLVIVDDYANALTSEMLDALAVYHAGGGRIILASIRLNNELSSHALLATAGVRIGADLPTPSLVYPWILAPLWQSRYTVPGLSEPEGLCPEDGFALVLEGAAGLGGFTTRFAADQAAVALSPDGRILVHGFMPQMFSAQDLNSNGIPDMTEVYGNEIRMLLTEDALASALTCSAGSFLNQPPMAAESMTTLLFSTAAGATTFEHFSGIDMPIGSVTWWGTFADSTIPDEAMSCTSPSSSFEISFYSDDGADIGALVTSQTLNSRVSDTGRFYLARFPGKRFKAVLSIPVTLNSGWLSIRHIPESAADTCYFGFLTSDQGDGVSRAGTDGTSAQAGDPAMCLGPRELHHADTDGDYSINLVELLRVVQFYNSESYGCATSSSPGDDGFLPGGTDHACAPHDADYVPQDWNINLQELLRVVQIYNVHRYYLCGSVDSETEDGFCLGEMPD